jgi:hypothetical protein
VRLSLAAARRYIYHRDRKGRAFPHIGRRSLLKFNVSN